MTHHGRVPRSTTRRTLARAPILLALLAVGCAPALHVPLGSEDAAAIRATRAHAHVAQEEIAAALERSNVAGAGGGGLLLALIDVAVESHRASAASKLMEPLRKEVGDFDFRAQLGRSLERTLAGLPALRVAHVTTTPRPLGPSELAAQWKEIPENAVLSLATTYELTTDFRAMIVATTATLWLRDREEPVYRGRYLYHTPPITASESREEAVARWAAAQGTATRAALTESIAETMKMLVLDLGPPATPVEKPTPKLSWLGIPGAHAFPAYLAQDGARYIVRHETVLFSLSSEDTFAAGGASAR